MASGAVHGGVSGGSEGNGRIDFPGGRAATSRPTKVAITFACPSWLCRGYEPPVIHADLGRKKLMMDGRIIGDNLRVLTWRQLSPEQIPGKTKGDRIMERRE